MPQNPQLFTGTVRYNLDPLESKSDDELFEALRDVKLLERLENNLYTDVRINFCNLIYFRFRFHCPFHLQTGGSRWYKF